MSTDKAPERVIAPWDGETVDLLNLLQYAPQMHPYTCGIDSNHILKATSQGWECIETGCEYKQVWAHRSSMDLAEMLYRRRNVDSQYP